MRLTLDEKNIVIDVVVAQRSAHKTKHQVEIVESHERSEGWKKSVI